MAARVRGFTNAFAVRGYLEWIARGTSELYRSAASPFHAGRHDDDFQPLTW